MTEKKTPPTLVRLLALLEAGYALDIRHSRDSGPGVLSLEHPARWQRLKEKTLLLFEDGSVLGTLPHQDGTQLLIDEDDETAFQALISATPKPSWWDRNNGPFYSVLAWALLLAVGLASIRIIDFLWGLVAGS